MRTGAVLLLSVCLASAQFGWFHRDRKPARKKDSRDDAVLGVVVKRSADSFVVRAVDSRIITFKITDETVYFRGWKWATPSHLKSATVVKVVSNADGDGILTASEVTFENTRPVFRPRARANDLLAGGVKEDPLIQQARHASDSFFALLPNFLCQQSTTRSYADRDRQWRTVDRVTAEVLYEHGHESYRDVKLNGKLTGRSMMDLPGSKSTGEFASTLRALFDKDTEAIFKFRWDTSLRGFSAAVYDFAVPGDQSDWRITAGSQMILTPYTGSIWIDRTSGNVVRIEMKAVDIPAAFPFRRVEAEIDYGPVALPSGRYFLPERAQNISCNDPPSCSRNVIEFRNYHKYIGESSISFDAPQ